MSGVMKKVSAARAALHVSLVALSLCFVLPLVMVASISLSRESAIAEFGYTLLPRALDFAAYRRVLASPAQLVNSYRTTIAFSTAGTFLSLLVQSLMAYPLSRGNYRYRNAVTVYIFVTMLFSGGLIPHYILNTQYLRLGNSIWIYILPGLVSAWNIIVLRTFFKGLPVGLVEAAKIDGASEIRVFFSIVLPLSKSVLATIGFMTLLAKWNDWNTALIYIREPRLYSLQYLLQRILREAEFLKSMAEQSGNVVFSREDMPSESLRFAMAVLASGPMLVVFPFFQKYFARGLTIGAIKG
jgi:putative aldouronate transport system permease protein